MTRTIARAVPAILALTAAAALAAGCGGSGGGGEKRIALVAFSTPKEAYEALIPAFQRTADGRGVEFTQSYGASGEQSRSVEGGLHADVVEFSLEPDVTRLVKAGLVAPSWNGGPHRGIVTDSVVVLATRKGNPRGIRGWSDLLKPGVEVITPNPFTSGGARWNIMAAYGSQIAQGASPAEAEQFLAKLFENVAVQDKSARDALQTFSSGKGDVLIAYENEAITARQKGIELDYVVPRETILIENPVAATLEPGDPEAAAAFVEFLYSPAAQAIFAQKGYRPVVEGTAGAERYPKPAKLFTIAKFGGWSMVGDRFFDPQKGVVAKIEREKGVSTESG
ncbi:MAG TPA: sulfate ABC transporter substrate-binding protein [Thermoleophilaceae bacterium]|jgi:sulfate transport system substrate-binding protein